MNIWSCAGIQFMTFGLLALAGCQGVGTGPGAAAAQRPADASMLVSDQTRGPNSATLTWAAPTRNENGSELKDLAGFRVYYGQDSSHLTAHVDFPGSDVRTGTIKNLAKGTWYFAVTAYTTAGVESSFTNVQSKTFD